MGCFSTKYGGYIPCNKCDDLFPDDYDLNKADLEAGGDGKIVICNLAEGDEATKREVAEYYRRKNRGKTVKWGEWNESE